MLSAGCTQCPAGFLPGGILRIMSFCSNRAYENSKPFMCRPCILFHRDCGATKLMLSIPSVNKTSWNTGSACTSAASCKIIGTHLTKATGQHNDSHLQLLFDRVWALMKCPGMLTSLIEQAQAFYEVFVEEMKVEMGLENLS